MTDSYFFTGTGIIRKSMFHSAIIKENVNDFSVYGGNDVYFTGSMENCINYMVYLYACLNAEKDEEFEAADGMKQFLITVDKEKENKIKDNEGSNK